MDKNEVALSITLALIEKGAYFTDSESNSGIGKDLSALYNGVLDNLHDSDSDE